MNAEVVRRDAGGIYVTVSLDFGSPGSPNQEFFSASGTTPDLGGACQFNLLSASDMRAMAGTLAVAAGIDLDEVSAEQLDPLRTYLVDRLSPMVADGLDDERAFMSAVDVYLRAGLPADESLSLYLIKPEEYVVRNSPLRLTTLGPDAEGNIQAVASFVDMTSDGFKVSGYLANDGALSEDPGRAVYAISGDGFNALANAFLVRSGAGFEPTDVDDLAQFFQKQFGGLATEPTVEVPNSPYLGGSATTIQPNFEQAHPRPLDIFVREIALAGTTGL